MILVTGGCGYIGAAMVESLLAAGESVAIVDNLIRSERKPLSGVPFAKIDVRDTAALSCFLAEHRVNSVIHLAGLMINDESLEQPDEYYSVNTGGTISILKAMRENDVRELLFASTSSIYESGDIALTEESRVAPNSPYGHSKWFAEQAILDQTAAYGLRAGIFRFFNVTGATQTVGEQHWPETCLIPKLYEACDLAVKGEEHHFTILGNEHPTPDGTCVRDYIHVLDLIAAHELLLKKLRNGQPGCYIYNLGCGRGYSVREIVEEAKVVSQALLCVVEQKEPRLGDPASLVADFGKAASELGWQPKRSLQDIMTSQWEWYQTSMGKQGKQLCL